MSKPVFVLVPGAFHLEGCLDPLAKHINEAGYKTKTTTLKSVGNADKTLTDDIAHLRDDVLLPLVESEDVVLVIHSYAGFPGSAAIKGLGKKDRQAKGLKGGILGVIYMCAFIPKEGDHLKGMIGGQWAPWQVPDEKAGLIGVSDPDNVFYADVPGAADHTAKVKGQSMKSFLEQQPLVAYTEPAYDGRRVYIRTENDQALPAFVQDLFIEGSGVKWDVVKLDTSHSPFLSTPADLTKTLVGFVEGWA